MSTKAGEDHSFEYDYLGWALRDLAVAEGWLSERPPSWSRLSHDAPLYAVVGRFLCLPLRPHTTKGPCWQPTTLVTEYEELTWADALAESRVRLSSPPPRPQGELPPAELAQARLAIASQAQALFVASAPPRPAGLPLTTSRWRAWRAWWIERDVQRQRTA